MALALGGVLCNAPLLVRGDENTNAPATTTPGNPYDQFSPKPNATAPSSQVIPATEAEAVQWLAQKGDAKAQYDLGVRYRVGDGFPKNPIEATKWIRKAADQGYAPAQYDLGVAYARGDGVEKNENEATGWFQKAADKGYVYAEYQLGQCYKYAVGVENDDVEAAEWFLKAANQGDANAEYEIGVCYEKGVGVETDLPEGAKWLAKAAEGGNPSAQCMLGAYYLMGKGGVQKNVNAAAEWEEKSAEQGNDEAQTGLGLFYLAGTGVDKDEAKAALWFEKAAKQGNSTAQFQLGRCYANGIGVEKDPFAAASWSRKAAEQGMSEAQRAVGAYFLSGFGVIKDETEGLAWWYVASASGNEQAPALIVQEETILSGSVVLAARQRATEIQAQIAARVIPEQANAIAPISQPAPASNTPKASGSGAFISADGLVLTAAHVVQGASRIEVVTSAGALPATVVKIDAANDIALLKCTGNGFTPLAIVPSKEAREGTTVFTIGFPNIEVQGFDPKLTRGEISSQSGFQDDPRQWQISVPIQPGNSGGPLCDENGNLIGIVEASLNPLTMAKVEGEIPQNVNYAVKSSYILPLLDDVQNLPPPLVPANGTKFEDTVNNAQKSVVLILVY